MLLILNNRVINIFIIKYMYNNLLFVEKKKQKQKICNFHNKKKIKFIILNV